MKKLSVIIVTYHSIEYIEGCLDSIFRNSNLSAEEMEVIIVENGNDETFQDLKKTVESRYQNIVLIHNNKNGGYGQGNNIGINRAKAKIVLVVNPDVQFEEYDFNEVLQRFSANPSLALIGGKQFGGMNMSFWIRPEFEFFLFTSPIMKLLNILNIYFESISFLSGAMLFIDKEKFEKIGMFDENIFLYREESDITKRILDNGYETLFIPQFSYRHLIDDRGKLTDFSFQQEMKSTKYYFEKFGFSFEYYLKQRLIYAKIMELLYLLVNKKEKRKQFSDTFKKIKSALINDSH